MRAKLKKNLTAPNRIQNKMFVFYSSLQHSMIRVSCSMDETSSIMNLLVSASS